MDPISVIWNEFQLEFSRNLSNSPLRNSLWDLDCLEAAYMGHLDSFALNQRYGHLPAQQQQWHAIRYTYRDVYAVDSTAEFEERWPLPAPAALPPPSEVLPQLHAPIAAKRQQPDARATLSSSSPISQALPSLDGSRRHDTPQSQHRGREDRGREDRGREDRGSSEHSHSRRQTALRESPLYDRRSRSPSMSQRRNLSPSQHHGGFSRGIYRRSRTPPRTYRRQSPAATSYRRSRSPARSVSRNQSPRPSRLQSRNPAQPQPQEASPAHVDPQHHHNHPQQQQPQVRAQSGVTGPHPPPQPALPMARGVPGPPGPWRPPGQGQSRSARRNRLLRHIAATAPPPQRRP